MDIGLIRLTDYALAYDTLANCWDEIAEGEVHVPDVLRDLYVGVYVDGEYAGMFSARNITGVMFDIHACLLPPYRSKSIEICGRFFVWMMENTEAQSLVAFIPDFNKKAMMAAALSGMDRACHMDSCFSKSGNCGVTQYHITKERVWHLYQQHSARLAAAA